MFHSHVKTARILLLLMLIGDLWLLCASAAVQPASETPTEVVRATLTEVFRILEDPTLKGPAQAKPRRRQLSEVQAYCNESVHEKLHELAGRIGLRKFPADA